MMTRQSCVARAAVAAVFAMTAVLAQPNEARAFLDSLNPFADTKDEFEGKFIDSLTPRAWVPPLERLAQEREASGQGGNNRLSGGKAGESDSFTEEQNKPATAEAESAPANIPDGLALLRMTDEWVANVPALEAYLNGIGARLLANSPVTGVPVRYYVTALRDFGLAKAMPDGAIGIPIAVIQESGTEDELAFMLAHEAAHVILEHHDNDWFQGLNRQFVSAAETAVGMSAAMAQKFGNTDLNNVAVLANLAAEGLLFLTDKGLFPSFSREQEDEADLLGLDLVMAAGYNSDEVFTSMKKLKSWANSAAEQKAQQNAERRAEIEEKMTASANKGDFDTAMGGLFQRLGIAAQEGTEAISGTHRDMEARIDSLFAYYEREYFESDPGTQATSIDLVRVRKLPEVAALFSGYDSAWDALKLVDEGELGAAEVLAIKAVSGGMNADSLARFAFFKTRLGQGHKGRAIQNLEIALKGPRPSLEVYRQLANMYWGEGRQGESMTVLGEAFEEFGKPPPLYADLIYRNFALGQTQKANALAIECGIKHRDMRELCLKASQGQAPELTQ
jgi:Zn-dependent protease with chaperone function